MDDTDKKILRTLQSYPESTVQQLAERVGLSHTPCWRRLKKLEADGVIQERAVILNPEAVNLPITVFAHIKVKQHDEQALEAFERAAQKRPEIVECYSMSGDSDYVCRILVASIADYEQFLKQVLLHLPGASAVNSSFALKRVKQTHKIPI